jgi:hypothetical protein
MCQAPAHAWRISACLLLQEINENVEERINLQKALFELEDINVCNQYELQNIEDMLQAGVHCLLAGCCCVCGCGFCVQLYCHVLGRMGQLHEPCVCTATGMHLLRCFAGHRCCMKS